VLLPTAYLVGSGLHGRSADAAALQAGVRSRAPICVATAESFSIANPGSLSKAERMRSRYSGFAYEPEDGWSSSAEELFSYDELASSMREIATYTRGDTVSGAVIGFEPNGALIDIGVKSSAYCTVRTAALHRRPFRRCTSRACPAYARAPPAAARVSGRALDARRHVRAGPQLQEMALVKPNKPEGVLEVGESYEFVIVSREVCTPTPPTPPRPPRPP
jgi:hypothetical protein